ncbi:hypothetical protein [Streptomyces sp. NPDC058394]|uniref:hypothetical protein n=1 Tax=Streptomyces sp. NPDC058394 TaxID=3346477 RepID=UPI00365B7DA4
MKDTDVCPVVLPEPEHKEILASQILPACAKGAVPQEQPVVVLVTDRFRMKSVWWLGSWVLCRQDLLGVC